MKKLDEEGVGLFKSQGVDKAFFKAQPTQEHKEKIQKFVDFEQYTEKFNQDIGKNITDTQKRRLMNMIPQTN